MGDARLRSNGGGFDHAPQGLQGPNRLGGCPGSGSAEERLPRDGARFHRHDEGGRDHRPARHHRPHDGGRLPGGPRNPSGCGNCRLAKHPRCPSSAHVHRYGRPVLPEGSSGGASAVALRIVAIRRQGRRLSSQRPEGPWSRADRPLHAPGASGHARERLERRVDASYRRRPQGVLEQGDPAPRQARSLRGERARRERLALRHSDGMGFRAPGNRIDVSSGARVPGESTTAARYRTCVGDGRVVHAAANALGLLPNEEPSSPRPR